jgi:hypothetical protein
MISEMTAGMKIAAQTPVDNGQQLTNMKGVFRTCAGVLSVSLCFSLFPDFTEAQPVKIPESDIHNRTVVRVAPGSHYQAGALHRLIFGSHWRSLWTIPIDVQVLDMKQFAGGLVPFEKGGGFQSITLRFHGADGREYRFRTVDKDPARGMPSRLRHTLISDVVQDQVSTSNPAGSLVISPLLDATGVYHTTPHMVVMPYDRERLGEFYDVFSGLLGTIEQQPDDRDEKGNSFYGADKVSGTYTFLDALENDHDQRIDAEAYLRARLLDLFIGDWDRHSGQWRWAGFRSGKGMLWKPVPRDRDNAFSRQDGVFSNIITHIIPQIEGFGAAYPDLKYLTWSARALDRRLLSSLDRSSWQRVTGSVHQQLTDDLIKASVRKLPADMYALEGQRLEQDLISRRDLLRPASDELYRFYAEDVDIHASDKPELALVERRSDGTVGVSLFRRSESSGERFYYRLFNPEETSDVRIYMLGGDDSVRIEGPVVRGIKVRVIGGGGQDSFTDLSTGAAGGNRTDLTMNFFYDEGEESVFKTGSYSVIERSSWKKPANDIEKYDMQPRDYGREVVANVTNLKADYSPDYGVFLGWGVIYENYGFRSVPFDYHVDVNGGVAVGDDIRYKLQFSGDFRRVIDGASLFVEAGRTELDIINFYGLGNERYFDSDNYEEEDFEIRQKLTYLRASLHYPRNKQYFFSAGGELRFIDLEVAPGSYLEMENPAGLDTDYSGEIHFGFRYHAGDCGEAIELSPRKQQGRLVSDRQLCGNAALSGSMVSLEGAYYPEFLGNQDAYARLKGELRTYIPISGLPYTRLALRVGGEKLWGDYPFYDAAFLGGSTSLRGYDRQRFAGDASLYAGSELRLYLGTFKFLVPVMYGPLGFVETGRVFLDGEDSSQWHTGIGGGLWFSFVESRYALSVVYGRGLDDGRLMSDYAIYIRTGFSF